MTIAISIYLLIGVIAAILSYRHLDKNIEKKEKGTISKFNSDSLERIRQGMSIIGGLTYILVFMSLIIIFWLPALLYGLIKKIK